VDINALVQIEVEVWKVFFFQVEIQSIKEYLVTTPRSGPSHINPVFVLNNDGLPDYETTTKSSYMKDVTPPPYNFVTTHPNEFGIDPRVPSAPPQYSSRRNSAATINPDVHIN
jgi:hypothetical protein